MNTPDWDAIVEASALPDLFRLPIRFAVFQKPDRIRALREWLATTEWNARFYPSDEHLIAGNQEFQAHVVLTHWHGAGSREHDAPAQYCEQLLRERFMDRRRGPLLIGTYSTPDWRLFDDGEHRATATLLFVDLERKFDLIVEDLECESISFRNRLFTELKTVGQAASRQ